MPIFIDGKRIIFNGGSTEVIQTTAADKRQPIEVSTLFFSGSQSFEISNGPLIAVDIAAHLTIERRGSTSSECTPTLG